LTGGKQNKADIRCVFGEKGKIDSAPHGRRSHGKRLPACNFELLGHNIQY
jgi:hypothetical protein